MTTNDAGKNLIKNCEACRLTSYLDAVGIPTIGYGHTGSEVHPGQTISQHQADVIFDADLERFEEGVTELLTGANVTDNQFSACVSLAFNIGITRFASSTLRKRLLAGDVAGAGAEFPRWNKAGGQVLPGLVKRRELERELFLS